MCVSVSLCVCYVSACGWIHRSLCDDGDVMWCDVMPTVYGGILVVKHIPFCGWPKCQPFWESIVKRILFSTKIPSKKDWLPLVERKTGPGLGSWVLGVLGGFALGFWWPKKGKKREKLDMLFYFFIFTTIGRMHPPPCAGRVLYCNCTGDGPSNLWDQSLQLVMYVYLLTSLLHTIPYHTIPTLGAFITVLFYWHNILFLRGWDEWKHRLDRLDRLDRWDRWDWIGWMKCWSSRLVPAVPP